MIEDLKKGLGKNLEKARKRARIETQTKAWSLSGVPQSNLSALETGSADDPKLWTVVKLALAYKVSLDEIVFGRGHGRKSKRAA